MDRAGAITVPPLIYVLFLVAGVWWRDLVPLSLGPRSLRWVIGGLVFGGGVALAVWAMTTMVRARTTFNPWVASTAVVRSGPFAFTRNPIYVGDALIYVGCALIFDSLFALLLLPLVLTIVYLGVIAREEAYLERKFGATYLDYKRRVRRWL